MTVILWQFSIITWWNPFIYFDKSVQKLREIHLTTLTNPTIWTNSTRARSEWVSDWLTDKARQWLDLSPIKDTTPNSRQHWSESSNFLLLSFYFCLFVVLCTKSLGLTMLKMRERKTFRRVSKVWAQVPSVKAEAIKEYLRKERCLQKINAAM